MAVMAESPANVTVRPTSGNAHNRFLIWTIRDLLSLIRVDYVTVIDGTCHFSQVFRGTEQDREEFMYLLCSSLTRLNESMSCHWSVHQLSVAQDN